MILEAYRPQWSSWQNVICSSPGQPSLFQMVTTAKLSSEEQHEEKLALSHRLSVSLTFSSATTLDIKSNTGHVGKDAHKPARWATLLKRLNANVLIMINANLPPFWHASNFKSQGLKTIQTGYYRLTLALNINTTVPTRLEKASLTDNAENRCSKRTVHHRSILEKHKS